MVRERDSEFETEGEREPIRDGGAGEAAGFVAGSVRELSLLARRHHLDTLAFLLDMAQMEAEERVRALAPRKARSSERRPDA